jgi:hypothetical protein
VFVQHGLASLGRLIAITLQTIFNTRSCATTGEPVFAGFMQARPSSTMWAWVYRGWFPAGRLAGVAGTAARRSSTCSCSACRDA